MNIHSVDLNLFLVFQTVYATRSVTLAGHRLDMTQSAVSNALKRARERFKDPLFVKTSAGMAPTALAERLIGPVEDGLRHLALAIDQGRRFDPRVSDRSFTIAVNDIGQLVLMPPLLEQARRIAPGFRIVTVDLPLDECRQRMMHGQVDLAIGSWEPFGTSFVRQRLFAERFVVVMGTRHPLAGRAALGLCDYMAAEHVAYRPHGATDLALRQNLLDAGIADQRRIVMTAAHSLGLGAIVAAEPLLLTAPRRLAEVLAASRPDLTIRGLPFDARAFDVSQQWHERFQPDDGSRWLRELVFDLFHERSPRPKASSAACLPA